MIPPTFPCVESYVIKVAYQGWTRRPGLWFVIRWKELHFLPMLWCNGPEKLISLQRPRRNTSGSRSPQRAIGTSRSRSPQRAIGTSRSWRPQRAIGIEADEWLQGWNWCVRRGWKLVYSILLLVRLRRWRMLGKRQWVLLLLWLRLIWMSFTSFSSFHMAILWRCQRCI